MKTVKAESTIVTSAILVFAIWGFRTLYEQGKEITKEAEKKGATTPTELLGFSQAPLKPAQFFVGYGFVYFTLSVGATISPKTASTFSVLVAVGALLGNGMEIFKDVNTAVGAVQAVGNETTTTSKTSTHITEGKENQKVRSHG